MAIDSFSIHYFGENNRPSRKLLFFSRKRLLFPIFIKNDNLGYLFRTDHQAELSFGFG